MPSGNHQPPTMVSLTKILPDSASQSCCNSLHSSSDSLVRQETLVLTRNEPGLLIFLYQSQYHDLLLLKYDALSRNRMGDLIEL
jgi:hypothetical protein